MHRQIIGIADPENPSQYARLTGTSLNVNVTNASLAVTAAALPTGAATEATLASIDSKTAEFGTAGTPSADVISVQGVSGGEPVKVDVVQPVVIQLATSGYAYLRKRHNNGKNRRRRIASDCHWVNRLSIKHIDCL